MAVAATLPAPASAATGVACAQTGAETVAADKRSYQPGEIVHLTGAGYASQCDVVVKVTRPDGAVVTGDGSFTPGSDTVTTDLFGGFSYDYQLPSMPAVEGWYTVEVLGFGDALLAQTSFVDAFAAGKLFLGSLAGPENYIYTAGDKIVSASDVDASSGTTRRAYKFFIHDASDVVRNSPTCTLNGTGGSVSYSYIVQADDPASTSADYELVLRQYSGATDAAALTACNSDTDGLGSDNEKASSKEFNLAKATAYANSALTIQQTSFGSATTLTGTVAKTSGGIALTGTGTSFSTQLAVGDTIAVPHSGGAGVDFRRIATITSNTSLTVNLAWSATASGQTASRSKQAYVTVAGLEQSQGDYSVTWLLPGGGIACANTAGGDQPNSDGDGELPNAAPAYLEYVPSDSVNNWNRQSLYDSGAAACPLFSAANRGQWKLRLERNPSHVVTLNVFSVNNPPTAAAGGPYSGNEGSAMQLDGSGSSDPDPGDTLTYAWSAPSGCTLSNAAAQKPTLTCDDNGTYTVSLTVTDSNGAASSPSTATVTVANVAPTATFPATRTLNEGASSTFAFTSATDPSAADTAAGFHYAFSCTGASLAGATYAGSGTASSVSCSFDDGPSSPTVRARIIDKDGGFSEYTTAVTVDNVAPTATFSGDSVDEGSSFTLTMSNGDDVSSADKAAKFTFAFDCGDGSGYGAFTTMPALSGSVSCPTNDNGTRSVKAKIRDKDGGVREYTDSVLVDNVAPTATLANDGPVDEGSPATISFSSQFDPSAGDTNAGFRYEYRCDGSSFGPADYDSAGSSPSAQCTFDDGPSTHTVRARIIDKDDGFTSYTTDVVVENVDPTAVLANDGPVDEGSSATISFSNQLDPSGADTAAGFHYAYSCSNGDLSGATYAGSGAAATTSCSYDDGPSSHVVKARIIDKDGGYSEYTTAVQVDNVAPTAVLANDGPVDEGSSATISFSNQLDPSGADTAAGFHYAYSCSNGDLSGATYAGSGAAATTSCSYDDGPSSHVVKARIIDKDGGYSEYTTTVSVENVAPTVTIDGPGQVNEGTTHTYTFTVADPGDDTFSVNEPDFPDCGDGGSYVAGTLVTDEDGGQFDCSFADGPATTNVAIRVTDSDGASDTGSEAVRVVAVDNVSPTADLGNDGPIDEGGSATISFSNPFDPSSADTAAGFHYAYSCSDGDLSGATYAGSATSASTTCSYDDGPSAHTVRARIIDRNGGYSEYTTVVQVDNVDPRAALANDGPVDEGSSATISFSNQFDRSEADSNAGFHYAFSCSNGDLSGATYAGSGMDATTTCSYDDGPSSHVVKARIIDKDGGFNEYTTVVHADNVAPTAALANDGPVDEGSPAAVSFSNEADASAADSAAGFRYQYHCDGSAFGAADYATADTSPSHQCTFADNGTYTVRARIIDKDDGFTSYTTDVLVENVVPTVTAAANQFSDEGDDHAFNLGSFADPGADEPWSVSVEWGDGTPTTEFTTGSTGSLGARSHAYADGPNNYTVTVTVTDKDGGSRSATFSAHVENLPPSTPSLVSPANDAVTNDAKPAFDWSDSTDAAGAADTIGYRIQIDNNCDFSSPELDTSGLTTSQLAPGSDLADGTYCWRVRASDEDGGASAYSAALRFTVDSVRPSVTINQATAQVDPTSAAPIKFAVVFSEAVSDFTNDDVDLSASTAGGTLTANVYDSGDHTTYEVRVNGMTTGGDVIAKITAEKAQDAAGNKNTASTSTDNVVAWRPAAGNTTPVVTIVSPAFGSVYAKGSAAINPLTVTASFTDPDFGPWTYVINWDDGSPNSTGSAMPAPSTFQATHSYSNPGVYTINVCVKDALMASGCGQVWIVVYDPNGGFVTGGGWLDVAPGSYRADTSLSGRANFGFNSQYKRNANVPTGETEFNFQVGKFNFHSTAYSWLVVSGYKAQYKGTGTVNGVSGYDFTLTAYDGQITGGGGVDKFRIRITQSNNGNVVFDNKYGVPTDVDVADPQKISGGSIVIHKA